MIVLFKGGQCWRGGIDEYRSYIHKYEHHIEDIIIGEDCK
jgi:hypothetical protein